MAGPRQRLATRVADMRSLPRMRQHVCSQVAERRGRLATRVADMRPLPQMRPHVHSQVTGPRECHEGSSGHAGAEYDLFANNL